MTDPSEPDSLALAGAPGGGVFRPLVLLPVFDQVATIEAVIAVTLEQDVEVWAVDDGSRDGSAEVLAQAPIRVLTHPANRGKGAALRTGFEAARAEGFTHAITLDTDGQHDPAEIPAIVAAAREAPRALILGERRLAGGAVDGRARRRWAKSRALRLHSNVWVWLATRRWLTDTQTGFRAYPLAPLADCRVVGDRYDFEIEVIVRLVRRGVPVHTVPITVRYPDGGGSHFRPIRDLLRCGATLLRVLLRG